MELQAYNKDKSRSRSKSREPESAQPTLSVNKENHFQKTLNEIQIKYQTRISNLQQSSEVTKSPITRKPSAKHVRHVTEVYLPTENSFQNSPSRLTVISMPTSPKTRSGALSPNASRASILSPSRMSNSSMKLKQKLLKPVLKSRSSIGRVSYGGGTFFGQNALTRK